MPLPRPPERPADHPAARPAAGPARGAGERLGDRPLQRLTRRRVAARALRLFLPFGGVIALVLVPALLIGEQHRLRSLEARLVTLLESTRLQIDSAFRTDVARSGLLAGTPLLRRQVGVAPSCASSRQELDDLLRRELVQEERYAAVRLFAADGRLLAGANRNGRPIQPCSPISSELPGLQQAFQAGLALQPQGIWFSPIRYPARSDLLGLPPREPVLLVVRPVLDPLGHRRAVLVLMTRAQLLLELFNQLTNQQSELQQGFLLDGQGQLLNRAPGQSEPFRRRFPGLWPRLQARPLGSVISPDQGLFVYRHLHPLQQRFSSGTDTRRMVEATLVSHQLRSRYHWLAVIRVPPPTLGQLGLLLPSPIWWPAGLLVVVVAGGCWRTAAQQLRLEQLGREHRQADSRLRDLIDNAAIGMAILDGRARVTHLNGALCRFLACEPGQLLGRDGRRGFSLGDSPLQNPGHQPEDQGSTLEAPKPEPLQLNDSQLDDAQPKDSHSNDSQLNNSQLRDSQRNDSQLRDPLDDPLQLEPLLQGQRDRSHLRLPFRAADGRQCWGDVNVSCLRDADAAVASLMVQVADITELVRKSDYLQTAAEAGIVGIWDWDIPNDHLTWDPVMYQLYGRRPDDFAGAYEAWASAVHPDDRPYAEAEIQAALRGWRPYAPRFRVVWPDGSLHHLQARSTTTYDAQGKPLRMIGVNYDVTALVEREQEIEEQRQFLAVTLKSLIDPHLVLTAWRDPQGSLADFSIADANPAAVALMGRSVERLVGTRLSSYFPPAAQGPPPLQSEPRLLALLRQVVDSGEPLIVDDSDLLQRLNGRGLPWCELRAVRLRDGVSLTIRDVSERHAAAVALDQRARCDGLTGLANRGEVLERMQSLNQGQRHGDHQLAVLFCDIDHFKEINDAHGHQGGDRTLQTLAERLRQAIRSGDLLGRIGGDELLVVLNGVAGLEEATALAERIRALAALPIELPSGRIQASLSIGVTLWDARDSIETLLTRADQAMYAAKQQGRNRVIPMAVLSPDVLSPDVLSPAGQDVPGGEHDP